MSKEKKCIVKECNKPIKKRSKDYCCMHRARLERTERLDLITTKEKLLSRVKTGNKTYNGTHCLEYTRYVDKLGYGRLRVNSKKTLAHRAMYEACNGEIPEDMLVLHRCDNPSCINIDHLFLGTPLDNVRDAIAKGRMHYQKNAGEKHE